MANWMRGFMGEENRLALIGWVGLSGVDKEGW